MRNRKNRWVRFTILAIGVVYVSLSAVFGNLRHVAKKDHDQAIPQEAGAVVTLIGPPVVEMDRPPTAQVLVQFMGRSRAVGEVLDVDKLQVGQAAKIIYRVGKSGNVYIDSIRPLTGMAQPDPHQMATPLSASPPH